MRENELIEQLQYTNSNELLVVTWYNELIVLKCPFKVMAVDKIGHIKKGEFVLVDKVKVTPDLITVFLIHNQAFYYSHFKILLV